VAQRSAAVQTVNLKIFHKIVARIRSWDEPVTGIARHHQMQQTVMPRLVQRFNQQFTG
jgi:hypothetical protein